MMRKLLLNGMEVCTSGLTQRSFRAAACDLLLHVTPRNKTEALAAFKQAGELGVYRGLRVSGIADLSFLREFPLLLYLEVVDQPRVNTRHLDSLRNLRGLHLETPGAGLDFGCFPELEVFSGDWHADNRSLDRAGELRRLHLRHFHPPASDLSELAGVTRLEHLKLTQTSITSLAGLETLEDLRYLEVAYAPKLEALDALATHACGIRELAFEKAKSIRSYRPIAAVGFLRRLRLSSCAPMPDLKWVAGLDRLDFFSFVETNVVDGDLSPLLELPRLRYVGTLDKRHYSIKCDALNRILDQRHAQAAAARHPPGTP